MIHINIKPCPFCGGKADIRHGTVYMDIVYRVECLSCHAITARFFVDHPCLDTKNGGTDEKTRYTEAEAICMAVNAWNRRTDK